MGWLLLIVVLVCVGGYLFYASYSIRSGVYVKALCKGETDKRVVCLTFDDGPDPKHTPQVPRKKRYTSRKIGRMIGLRLVVS